MRSRGKIGFIRALLSCMVLLSAGATSVWATGTIGSPSVTPGTATANSVYEFSCVYKDDPTIDQGMPKYPVSIELSIDDHVVGTIGAADVASMGSYFNQTLRGGIKVIFRMSAGLDTAPGGGGFGPNTLFGAGQTWRQVKYTNLLRSYGNGPPLGHNFKFKMQYMPDATEADPEPKMLETTVAGAGPTVHDSMYTATEFGGKYGGYSGSKDSLDTFPVGYPTQLRVDPLTVDDAGYVQFTDDGTSTDTYKFRVRYYHPYDLKPGAWVFSGRDYWNSPGHESGVMLYMRNIDKSDPTKSNFDPYWGVFRGHHMYQESVDASNFDCIYTLNVGPMGPIIWNGDAHYQNINAYTNNTNHLYEGLPPGRYEYYFACSDDDYSAVHDENSGGSYIWDYLDDYNEMGSSGGVMQYGSLPTPPPPDDRLWGGMGLNWKSIAGPDGVKHGYVDKRTYFPGGWINGYPYDSYRGLSTSTYGLDIINNIYKMYPTYTSPQVDPGLYGPNTIGGARFLGTLSPYKRAVNPNVPNQNVGQWRQWAETAGGTAQDQFTFQVMYYQSIGRTPSYVRLLIKNDWNAEDPTGFRSYDMQPAPGQDLREFQNGFKTGIKYQVTLSGMQLGYGPHVYYFEAADKEWKDNRYFSLTNLEVNAGGRNVRFPRRPQSYTYDYKFNVVGASLSNTWWDQMLPSRLATEAENIAPWENDFINGPFISHKPEIVSNSWSVSPTAGSSGTEFVYRVKYRDLDNQRPFSAKITIISDSGAGTSYTASMYRAPDSSVPGNSTATYADGVIYEFKTSSAPGLSMAVGNHTYRFEFVDDWGRETVQDDRISGELVDTGWIGGPYVSGNSAPRLTLGSVESADGTTNEATTWNYKVTYTDADNNPPAYMVAFIGRQDAPGGPISWDSGHSMTPVNPTDSVYSDGRTYQFSTRLPGSNATPIKYYSCYVASDGLVSANYQVTNSPSSGMVWPLSTATADMQQLTAVGASTVTYAFAHKPLVTNLAASSIDLNPTNYVSPVLYVGSVLQAEAINYTLDALNGQVTFNVAPVSPVYAKYWFGTEPDPTKGPVAVTGNHPPVLVDGKVLPLKGSSATNFTYSVTYRDSDDQEPQYINAVIDDVRYPMSNIRNSKTYKAGVEYQCSTTLSTGSHQFYFEASDGGAMFVFDADLASSSIDPIVGPYVNNRPFFSDTSVAPSGIIDQGQPITYSITVNDGDNDQPVSGYPVVYVDNPNEVDWTGTVTAAPGNRIIDNVQSWTVNAFKGMPVEVSIVDGSGNTNKVIYKIASNTATELYLVASDVEDSVTVGSPYSIGKLSMVKTDPGDLIYSDGVTYETKVPSLGVGLHSAHFKCVVSEETSPGVFEDYTLRAPVTGELSGPTVEANAPAGNIAPVLTNGAVDPRTGSESTAFRFAVTYTDANANSPFLTHDGVTGYAKVYIEETPGNFVEHELATDIDAPNFSTGVELSYARSGLVLGPHNYYFEASDGWVSTRFPSTGYLTAYVSRPPVLLNGQVTPISGNSGRVFEYKVTYRDPDGDVPAFIRLVIDNGAPIDIGVPVPGADYTSGVVYSYPLLKGTLDESLHNFYFVASDGNGYAWYDKDVRDQETAQAANPGKSSTTNTPPSVVVPIDGPSLHSNTDPSLSTGTVTPSTGYDLDTFTFSVKYTDPDGDEPEYVECYIDDPNPASPNVARAYKMTKSPTQTDFSGGVTYILDKTGLSTGSHTYYFKTSDWLGTAFYPANGTSTLSGPTVSARATATITINAPASVPIGDSVTITGSVRGYGNIAVPGVPVKLRLMKPDGSIVSPQPEVTTAANGTFTYPATGTWKPSVTGVWKLQASWVGNTQYLLSTSAEKTMVVAGPSISVNGLDMISIPLQPVNSFADGVFGTTPAYALAKWLPKSVDYKLYSLLPGIRTDYDFPAIAPGQSYWIKTLVAKTIAPTGTLVDPYTDYSVSIPAGWNMVGNPFTSDVAWSTLLVKRTINGVVNQVSLATAAANGWIKEYGWTYDTSSGNYRLVDATRTGAERTMRPWRGYWMKSIMNCTLVIPAPGRSSRSGDLTTMSAGDAGSPAQSAGSAKWQVQLVAKNGALTDEFNYIGAASGGDDKVESPGCFQNYVDAYITDDKGGSFASYLKGKAGAGQSWTVNVATDRAGEVELTWAGLDSLPSNLRLVLVDEDGKSIEMKQGGSIKFTAGEGGTIKSYQVNIEK